jgi:hypothetical protein
MRLHVKRDGGGCASRGSAGFSGGQQCTAGPGGGLSVVSAHPTDRALVVCVDGSHGTSVVVQPNETGSSLWPSAAGACGVELETNDKGSQQGNKWERSSIVP